MYKIAIVGPESTGKSALAESLAAYFNCTWIPEAAREYLEKLNRPYDYDDLLRIAELQCRSEDSADEHRMLICDTTLLVIKIWSEVRYDDCDPWILKNEEERRYDFFLLTDIDLPWEDDPLREHPHLREFLFAKYHTALKNKQVPYGIVSGKGPERLANAVRLLRENGISLDGK